MIIHLMVFLAIHNYPYDYLYDPVYLTEFKINLQVPLYTPLLQAEFSIDMYEVTLLYL
jgi:hypothetical protein